MGFFWALQDAVSVEDDAAIRGYVKLGANGLVDLETLIEDPVESFDRFGEDERDDPKAMYGVTTDGDVLLFNPRLSHESVVFGLKASVRKFQAYSLARNVDYTNLNSLKVRELEIFFPGVERWVDIKISDEKWEHHDDGRLKAFTLQVSSAPRKSVSLTDGRALGVSAYWSVVGPESRRTVYAPVTVVCRSERPVELWDLLSPILRVQDLISLAYDGFVAADGGVVDFDYAKQPPSRAQFWNHFLMFTQPRVVTPKSLTDRPLFLLENIGGVEALDRWVRMTNDHIRLVKPIVNQLRLGFASPELRLMELAAAMEYWCAANRRKPGYEWTAVARERTPSIAIARHLGEPVAKWIGDGDVWGDLFWRRYNQLKHEPTYIVDEGEIDLLAKVGFRLLVAEVLRELSGSAAVVSMYLSSAKISNLGWAVKKTFALSEPQNRTES